MPRRKKTRADTLQHALDLLPHLVRDPGVDKAALARETNRSIPTLYRHLRLLEQQGYISLGEGRVLIREPSAEPFKGYIEVFNTDGSLILRVRPGLDVIVRHGEACIEIEITPGHKGVCSHAIEKPGEQD